jgi:hypothetical protein
MSDSKNTQNQPKPKEVPKTRELPRKKINERGTRRLEQPPFPTKKEKK